MKRTRSKINRKRIKKRRSRNFGKSKDENKTENMEETIDSNDGEVKNTANKIAKFTGIKAIKKPGFIDKIFNWINNKIFPMPTQEQINKLDYKNRIIMYLSDTEMGKYLIKKYSYLLNKEDFFKRALASGVIKF